MKTSPQIDKITSVLFGIGRVLGALACLYFFICSLELLTVSFRLISGQSGGSLFSESEILNNPIVGVMIGVLGTVLVQSSSTTSSIIVSMVASGILTIKAAVPMIMGANIGTSVTNTIVSFTQVTDRSVFERSFACAVLHDMFNWIAVIAFLILEVVTGYLQNVSGLLVDSFNLESSGEDPPKFLSVLTDPLTEKIIVLDSDVLQGWLQNDPAYLNVSTLLLTDCENSTDGSLYQCGYLFAECGLEDKWIGAILFVVSFIVLTSCLVLLVKILNALMKAQMAVVIQKLLNANIPYVPWLTGYIAIIAGALITILVQSSSVFTCTLTPLVGTGFFDLERAYPLTLGSNIGTTTTGLLAALATEGVSLKPALQIALCHLLFNISGILVFYPLPFMRWPLPMARAMGRTVAVYRWFAPIYLILSFIIIPLIIFNLSLLIGGDLAIYAVLLPVMILFIIIVLINVVQARWPSALPKPLRDWSWLPLFLRSLEPYDKIFSKCICTREKEESDPEIPMTKDGDSEEPKDKVENTDDRIGA